VTETHVLLQRAEMDDFWALPGGHVEIGETAAEALQRELLEEIEAAVQVGRLLWVVENFFSYAKQAHHEIGLYFQVFFAPGDPLLQAESFYGVETAEPLIGHPFRLEFRWFPRQVEVLTRLPVLPAFLQEGLVNLPAFPNLILERDA
jgi:ADP-ribose pyrophosphatase YjhB (NUDIX family)